MSQLIIANANTRPVSIFSQSELPSFMVEWGPKLVEFLRQYIKWQESSGQTLFNQTNFKLLMDIDKLEEYYQRYLLKETPDQANDPNTLVALNNLIESIEDRYRNTYMVSMPKTACSFKLLLKHILDIYRRGGSINSFKLFFRAVYGVDCDIYLPRTDMFTLSDNEWIVDHYIQAVYDPQVFSLVGKQIQGIYSGATAIVEQIVIKPVRGLLIAQIYLSNIVKDFINQERIKVI